MLAPPLSIGPHAGDLRSVVTALAGIGPRNIQHYDALCAAHDLVARAFGRAGYAPALQTYQVDGKSFCNVVVQQNGLASPQNIFIVGAHYDTHKNSPGANDNGSAVAALLALARLARERISRVTLRFVAFTNEEAPFTRTRNMGSLVYARECREKRENIVGMLCLETLGSYSEEIGSQRLSLRGLLLPRQGNFLALVGDRKSRQLLRTVGLALRREQTLRYQSLTLPRFLPGARSSDHWSFWKNGFPAVMATDTAFLRYRYYHSHNDTPDKIDFDWLERVVFALDAVVQNLGSGRLDP
jgi:Zn-dependent M28 family amino/carboxypeptidase